jgi:hypothetical protein
MKRTIRFVAILALGILTGCPNSREVRRGEPTLSAPQEDGRYDVDFVVRDWSGSGGPSRVSAPRLSLPVGQEVSVSAGDGRNGINYTTLVDDAGGKPEARAAVSVQRNVNLLWSDDQPAGISE